jgi:hypothetical protein
MTEPHINSLSDLFNKNPDTNYEYEIPFIVSNENQITTEEKKPSLSEIMIPQNGNDIIFVAYDVGFNTQQDILNQIYNYNICDNISVNTHKKTDKKVYLYKAPSRSKFKKEHYLHASDTVLIDKTISHEPYIYSGAILNKNIKVKVYDFIATHLDVNNHGTVAYDTSFFEKDEKKEKSSYENVCTFADPILQGYRFDTHVLQEDKLRIVYITLYKVDKDRVNDDFQRHLMQKGNNYYSIKIKITSYHPKNTFTTQEFFLPLTLFRLGSYNENDESFKLNCKHVLDYIGLVFFLPIVKAENIYETVNNTYKQPNPYHLDPLTTPAGNIYELPNPPTNPPANPPTNPPANPPTNPVYSQVLSFNRPLLNPNDLYAQPINALQPPEKPKYKKVIIKPTTNEPPPLPPRGRLVGGRLVGGSYKPRKTKKHSRTHPKTHSRKHSKSTRKHVKNTVKK